MALSVARGSFAANTSTGDQAITGLGFQPKAMLFYSSMQTAAGYGTDGATMLGLADATAEGGIASRRTDNSATGAKSHSETKALTFINANNTLDAEGTVVLDSDGFTVNWSDAPASAWVIQYLALGGSDVENVKVGAYQTPADPTTGNVSTTGVGFQPNFLLAVHCFAGSAGTSSGGAPSMGIGCATSSRARWAVSATEFAFRANTDRWITFQGIGQGNNGADFVSFGSDGWTSNWSASPFTARRAVYMAIEFTEPPVVGNDTQKTSTGTKATTGVGFTPKALLLSGTGGVGSNNNDGTGATVGSAVSGSEGFMWYGGLDSGGGRYDRAYTVDKATRHATRASTTNAEADLSSLDADGFTLDWTTADGNADVFMYAAFGEASSSVDATVDADTANAVADGVSAALTHAVAASSSVTVPAPASGVSVALTHQVSAVTDATVTVPAPALGVDGTIAPAVTASSTVTALPATGLGQAPITGNETSAQVTVPVAQGNMGVVTHTVSADGSTSTVEAVPAVGSPAGLTHSLSAASEVVSVAADAVGGTLTHQVTAEVGAIVTAVPADCVGFMSAPLVSDGVEDDTPTYWVETIPSIPVVPVLGED
jgi:hypothetical protein